MTSVRWASFLLAAALAAAACLPGGPALRAGDEVPDDLRALAEDLWPRFVEAFPARRDCLGEVRLTVAWDLEDRARYLPEARTVVVRAPATAPHLVASIVHELGHHLEFACADQRRVRSAFLRADGLPEAAPWFGDGEWSAAPSEHWAEAVVAYVVGERSFDRGRIPVTAEAVELVARWARGG